MTYPPHGKLTLLVTFINLYKFQVVVVGMDFFVLIWPLLKKKKKKNINIYLTRYSSRNAPVNTELVCSAGFKEYKKTS